ncbi:MAG: caspase family protein, partial [Candidatus Binatia bacterium]
VKGLPESGNILAELDRLARDAQYGDTVIFYYSGHGSRQPADPNRLDDEPEADGMDQVLLPSDAGVYDPIKLTLRNAIIDNTLGDKIAAIRVKAYVWVIIDACHSATVTRGKDVTRCVDSAKLGVPATPPSISRGANPIVIDPNSQVAAPPTISRGGERQGTLQALRIPGDGSLVGFYAVESYDQAIERPFPSYNLPMVGEGKDQRMGVFTYQLHRALTNNTAATYYDLAQQIVAEMSSDRSGGKVPPPVFDGQIYLYFKIPGSNGAGLPNSVTGTVADGKISFSAGSLHGFDVGARLALYAPGKPEKTVGHADVSEATAVTSEADAINWEQGVDRLPTVSARIEAPAINFRFVVSPPPLEDFSGYAEKDLVTSSISAALRNEAINLGIEIGDPADPDADAMLRVRNNRLWIVRADQLWEMRAGAYNETPSLGLDDGAEELSAALKNAIWRMARATKLLRIASALDVGRRGDAGRTDDGLTITADISIVPGQDARAACTGSEPSSDSQSNSLEPSSSLQPLIPKPAGNCSFVMIQVKNSSEIDYYVAGFYVDSLDSIVA